MSGNLAGLTGTDYIGPSLKENFTAHVIRGRGWLFIFIYLLICFLFSLFVIFSVIVTLAFMGLTVFGRVSAADAASLIPHVFSFHFGGLFSPGMEMAEQTNVIAAVCAADALAGVTFALVFGVLLKIYKGLSTGKREVPALLPGRMRGYIPSDEGVYKLICINFVTGSRFYSLYPWSSLHLHYIDERKRSILLKLRYFKICLRGRPGKGGGRDYFNELMEIVLERLPETPRVPSKKHDGFKWWLAVVLTVAVFVFGNIGAGYYENISGKSDGSRWCDIGGQIHLSPEPYSFYGPSDRAYIYEVYENQEIRHRYCLLHGGIFATLHPVVHIRSMRKIADEQGARVLFSDPLVVLFIWVFPLCWWLLAAFIIFGVSRPQVMRFQDL